MNASWWGHLMSSTAAACEGLWCGTGWVFLVGWFDTLLGPETSGPDGPGWDGHGWLVSWCLSC